MKYIVRWIAAIVFCLAVTEIGWTQTDDGDLQSDLGLLWTVPQNAFAENVTTPGIGVRGSVGGRVPDRPIALFSEIGFVSYGSENHLELTQFREHFEDVDFTAPVSVIGVESDKKFLMGHLIARLQPSLGMIEPYIEGLLGFKYFISRTRVAGDIAFNWNPVEGSSDFDDFVPSFGAGGGMHVQVFDGSMGLADQTGRLSLNFGIRYLFGPPASYLADNAVRATDDGITFAVERTRTDMLVPTVGLRIER